jgi:diaminopimelate decarboxylase
MASSYNSRLLVPEVMVSDDRFAVVRTRPSFDDMIGMDTIPDWLDEPPVRVARGAA